jgi:DNA-binding NarL/FixJ family response regulator
VPAILIIDDHAIMRRGIRQTLNEEIRDLVFCEASNGREGMAQVAKRNWDLIILNVSLPDRDGFSLLRQILEVRSRARVLVLSVHPALGYAAQARQLGAFGYLSKDARLDRFLAAVRSILAGNKYFSRLSRKRDQLHTGDPVPSHQSLSMREREVMLALVAGRRIGEIAGSLSLSVKTVSTFKRRLLNKLGAASVADLVRYVIENEL